MYKMRFSVDFLLVLRRSWKFLNLESFEELKSQNFFVSEGALELDLTPRSDVVSVAEELVFR